MTERLSLDLHKVDADQAGPAEVGEVESGIVLHSQGVPEAEELEWEVLPSDPVQSAERDTNHEQNTSTQEGDIIDINVVVEEPANTSSAAENQKEIDRLRQELDLVAGPDPESGIVRVSQDHDYRNEDPTDQSGINVSRSTRDQSTYKPDQVIDVGGDVEPVKEAGRMTKIKNAVSRGLRGLVDKIRPTPMTPESAQATIERAEQVEGEYAFWVSEANKVSSRIVEIESMLRANPDLKRQFSEELRSLRANQEEIRRGQARRQKILFPLRDKAIHAKRMVDSVSKGAARGEEVKQAEERTSEYAGRLQHEMFLATDWVNVWNEKFGRVFNLNLAEITEAEQKNGGRVKISHLNGMDFEQVLWEHYQKSRATSVKINREQFKHMVGQVFIDLSSRNN